MEGIGVFMMAVAVAFGATFMVSCFMKKNENSVYFAPPTRSSFNVSWGLLFFIVYGMMMTRESEWLWVFVLLATVDAVYLIYLYMMRAFLSGRNVPIVKNVVNWQTRKQQALDEVFAKYSKVKAAKILGLTVYELKADNVKELAKNRYQRLKTLADMGNISEPYFSEMTRKAQDAI